jgi:hypothetical protein
MFENNPGYESGDQEGAFQGKNRSSESRARVPLKNLPQIRFISLLTFVSRKSHAMSIT